MPTFSETTPPHSLEAESAVLGSMLVSPVGRATCVQDLKPADFYSTKHAHLFKVICDLDDKGPVEILDVVEHLKAQGKLEWVGGAGYILNLPANLIMSNGVVNPDAPDTATRIVREKAQRRRLLEALRESFAVAEDEVHSVDEILSAVEGKVLAVREPTKTGMDIPEWANMLEIETAIVSAGGEGRQRVKTGLYWLDKRLKLWPGRLTVLAGGASQGKSAVALAIAATASLSLGQRVYYWTGEMDENEMRERIFASAFSVNYEDVQERRLSERDLLHLHEFVRKAKDAPLTIQDAPMTVSDIRADCRYIAHTHGKIGLVIVDYLALLKDLNIETEGQDRRDVRIGIIVWNLIRLARELECHVILLHQLNREKDKRSGSSRPRVSDLKDSSTIEQHAHNVVLVYRPDRDETLTEEKREQYLKRMELIIGKQRGGKVGSVWITFDGDTQQVQSLDQAYWPKG